MTYTPKLPDMEHQTRAKVKARGRDAFAFFMETGTGKSKVALDELGELADAGAIDRALILAGAGSYADWVDKHTPENFSLPYEAVLWTGSSSKRERSALDWVGRPPDGAFRLLVMNVEALSSGDRAFDAAVRFLKGGRGAAVLDEASKIKSHDASRSRACWALARLAVHRRILTGTPVTQGPMDLWSQGEFLGRGFSGSESYSAFRARYAVLRDQRIQDNRPLTRREELAGGRRGRVAKVIQRDAGGRKMYKNLSDLARRVDAWSFSCTKDECLDLPPKIYVKRRVEATDEQRRLYDEMRRWCVAQLQDGVFASAQLALTQIAKMHQIMCGHVRDEEGILRRVPSNRVKVLLDEVDETAGKVIVWCAYRNDVEVVAEALRAAHGPDTVVEYHGGTDPGDRRRAVQRMQEDSECRFFVSTTPTGGYGITLTAASTAIYFSNNFSLEHRLQSEDRFYRIGQTRSVTCVDLCVPDTVDEKVIAALREKREIADVVAGREIGEWLA